MSPLATLDRDSLVALRRRLEAEYEAFRGRGVRLDLTRGKPAADQLDLSNALLDLPGRDGYTAADGSDCRNYFGDPAGLPEARALFAPVLGASPDQVVIGDNSSLAMMHDAIVYAMLHGVPGGRAPWGRGEPVAFLCPVPGYDRHFAICDTLGIRMVPIDLTGEGPDLAAVERHVADPSVKGMWCVPKYSNPTGEIYSPATIERLARMKTAAADFRLFWDNAYAVHHLTETRHVIASVLDACARAGQPDRALVFASTSKITFAGAGLALMAASKTNRDWFLRRMGLRSIGPDKLNQLRHVRLLGDRTGLDALMDRHRHLLAPKFQAVDDALTRRLGRAGVASWSKPAGGYFISVDVEVGSARRVEALAAAAGIALVPAGRTFPGGHDPRDRNLRLAPSFPSVADVAQAAEGVALAVLMAATERLLGANE